MLWPKELLPYRTGSELRKRRSYLDGWWKKKRRKAGVIPAAACAPLPIVQLVQPAALALETVASPQLPLLQLPPVDDSDLDDADEADVDDEDAGEDAGEDASEDASEVASEEASGVVELTRSCEICMDAIGGEVLSCGHGFAEHPDGHVFHEGCLLRHIQQPNTPNTCPTCRQPLRQALLAMAEAAAIFPSRDDLARLGSLLAAAEDAQHVRLTGEDVIFADLASLAPPLRRASEPAASSAAVQVVAGQSMCIV